MRLLKRSGGLASCLIAALALSGCLIGTDSVRDYIKGDYCIWAMEADWQTQFIHANDGAPWPGTTIVNSTVTRAGWDDKWVLLEQFPRDKFEVKLGDIGWQRQYYIFSLPDEKLYGPYNRQKFMAQRMKLDVPATLEFDQFYAKSSDTLEKQE